MDIKKIKELMKAMIEHDMQGLSVKDKTGEISLERSCCHGYHHCEAPVAKAAAPKEAEAVSETEGFITSPMVGSFFMAPTPEASPFVNVGDKVEKESVVCIIEAMKVMNEVKAGVDGIIEEVLMESGHPVEFGTKLFRVRKNA